jgi:hypothetical protein
MEFVVFTGIRRAGRFFGKACGGMPQPRSRGGRHGGEDSGDSELDRLERMSV